MHSRSPVHPRTTNQKHMVEGSVEISSHSPQKRYANGAAAVSVDEALRFVYCYPRVPCMFNLD